MKNVWGWCLVGLAVWGANVPAAEDKAAITVFGAASLTNALQDLGDTYSKETSVPVRFSFAASSTLAKQIENGSPADIFFSADLDWMDYLQEHKLIQVASRHDALGNQLVLVAPLDSKIRLKIQPHFALAAAIGGGRLATGDPASVPVGRYAKQALTSLGVWEEISAHLVPADSVRSALAFVDRGEVPLGIVYETDALIDKKVRVVDVFPVGSHLPIVYPIAETMAVMTDAAKFVAYVRGPAGDVAFKAYGFTPLH
jgi:molybdate transport system substrate-binding protein